MAKIQVHVMNIERAAELAPDSIKDFPNRLIRANRFRFEADRLRTLAATHLLKSVLGISEDKLSIGEKGKPYIEGGPEFNLSHSGDYAVLATSDKSIGVDIERVDLRHLDVARRVFTAEEIEWMNVDPEKRFWSLWTLKEAASKAVGKGLSLEYRSFSVLPLLRGESIELDGVRYFGLNEALEDYSISVVSEELFDGIELKLH